MEASRPLPVQEWVDRVPPQLERQMQALVRDGVEVVAGEGLALVLG